MGTWKMASFRRLRDTSPEDVPMRWRMSRGAVGSTQVGVSRFTYEPGASMPYAHRHGEQEEVYVVVAGSGQARLDGEVVELATWDVLKVPPHVWRTFRAGEDGMDVICVGGERPAGNDAEQRGEPW